MDEIPLDLAALGRAIRRRREALNWSRHRLAQKAGVSAPHLRTLEEGRSKRIGLQMLIRLATALGLSAGELLREAGISAGENLSGEMDLVYRQLDPSWRRTWLAVGRVLVDRQDEEDR